MNKYNIEKILNNNNIIFDIKSDITFKNIFIKKCGINYMKQILENLFDIDINKELKLLGMPTFKIKKITQLNINQINLL